MIDHATTVYQLQQILAGSYDQNLFLLMKSLQVNKSQCESQNVQPHPSITILYHILNLASIYLSLARAMPL